MLDDDISSAKPEELSTKGQTIPFASDIIAHEIVKVHDLLLLFIPSVAAVPRYLIAFHRILSYTNSCCTA